MSTRVAVVFLVASLGCGGSQVSEAPPTAEAPRADGPPATAVRPVTNTYHGTAVVDPYQWLEQDSDEVKQWSDAQNAYALEQLDALPNLVALQSEIEKLLLDPSPAYGSPHLAGGKLFMLKHQPPKEQAFLIVFDDPATLSNSRTVLDPTTIDTEGTTTIDWFVPSPDGTRIAVSMSRRGSERGDLSIYDTATGAALPDRIEHVENGTAGGDLVWTPDGKGFYYTRYPRTGERPEDESKFYQQVWYHRLGSPIAEDRYELGKGFPRIAEFRLEAHPGSGEVLATVQNGDGGDTAHYLRETDGRWTQMSQLGDGTKAILFNPAGGFVALSRKDAPRGQLFVLPAKARDMTQAKLIVPQSEDSIDWSFYYGGRLVVTPHLIYVVYQRGGPSHVMAFDHTGASKSIVSGPNASVGSLTPFGGDAVLFGSSSFIEPGGWFRYSPDGRAQHIDEISTPASVDFSDVEVVREMATSKDGTKVPVNIILAKDHPRDGSRPCIASGYGGYGISITPGYRPLMRPLLDRGVCFAIANLRGGGEFGDAWHRDGMLTRKQNVFDDFAAVLEHLVARGYTSRERLGIIGGSNGGLLMGALLTQRPELVRAVVSSVGIYDSLRTELSPNGEFNVTEFGTVKDEAQFRALYAYSPYHAVRDQTAYPAVLLTTGDNDPRVSPWQSRKFAARLQAATSSDQPILLRTSAKSGHSAGNLSEAVSLIAHQWAFLLHHIGAD